MLKLCPTKANRRDHLRRHFNRFKDQKTCRKVLKQLISTKQKHQIECPHCQSCSTVRFGKYRDRQRYKCQNCNRTFNDLTNTPLHYTHSPLKWIKFIHCLIEKLTLAEACFEVKITYSTAHYWRHKLIHALERLAPHSMKGFPCSGTYPYICVRQYPPGFHGQAQDRLRFAKWIKSFQWIARRYVDRYIAWFHFVQKLDTLKELESIQRILSDVCTLSIPQTYETVKM